MKYLISFGINKYGPAYGGNANLQKCVYDAERVANMAESKNFNEVTVLTDKECTIASFNAVLSNLAKKVVPGDLVVFFQSSHGTYHDLQGGKRATGLCMHDGVLWDYMANKVWAKFAKGVRVTYLTDSCFAESNYRNAGLPPIEIRRKYIKAPKAAEPVPTALKAIKCEFTALLSSTINQSSYEVVEGGVFTSALLSYSNSIAEFSAETLRNRIDGQISDFQNPVLETRVKRLRKQPIF